MTIDVGPYRFTVTDARQTLGMVDALVDFLPAEAHQALTATRARVLAVADGVGDDDDGLAAAVAEVFPLLMEARSIVAGAGALSPTATGSVAQLSVSDGGVPKLAVDRVEVDFGGIVNDRQAARRHHGRPWQAVCLWSTEVIASLAAAGHPIGPGAAGENITIEGLDWSHVVGGSRLGVGSTVLQVMAPAVPCAKNARWFADGVFDRIHHRHGPISRLYAVVVEPGAIAVGDAVVLEPAG